MKELIHDYETNEYFIVDSDNLEYLCKIANIPRMKIIPDSDTTYDSGILMRTKEGDRYFFFYKYHKDKLTPREIQKISRDYTEYNLSLFKTYIPKSTAIRYAECTKYSVERIGKMFNLKEY